MLSMYFGNMLYLCSSFQANPMKKKLIPVLFVLISLVGLSSCSLMHCPKKSAKTKTAALATQMDTVSYFIGMEIGQSFKTNFIDIKSEALLKGVQDAMKGNDSLFSAEVKDSVMTAFQNQLQMADMQRREKISSDNRQEEETFMQENKKDPLVKVTDSGIQYKILVLGTGDKPAATDTVRVHYAGKFVNGEIFDASRNYGPDPVEFPLNGVIPGWTEALQLMPVGSIFEIVLPADLAYGERGYNKIPPAKMLIFVVELMEIVKH